MNKKETAPIRDKPYKPIQNRLMIPLFLLLLILIFSFCSLIIWLEQIKIDTTGKNIINNASASLIRILEEQAEDLSAIQAALLNDDDLNKALKHQDRDQLLAMYRLLFLQLKNKYAITHLYFNAVDRTNIVRIHKPEKQGGLISRFTMLEAQQTGEISSGIELGSIGTFTLRVVQPVFEGPTLIGYLELGKEIEDILYSIHLKSNVELIVSIHKTGLTKKNWEKGM
ncbi:MAG: hypothetical protein GY729_08955, partial [Desulfobacteraceae bacterium]|nr:hypothetical protein [Desulfobacteraceae bacterium]